jgi:predicted metal-dependent HD superfamily phosphohydrolase
VTSDHAIFLDIDLSVLSLPPAKYARYAENIRREYAHKPLVKFLEQRTAVLRHILGRENIYHDSVIREELQARARSNVESEVSAIAEVLALYAQ